MTEIPNSPQSVSLEAHRPAVRIADLAEMTKPGITLMVVLTAGLGFLLAGG